MNRYLTLWRLDQPRLPHESEAVRLQAEHSNDCWQFDISPPDLKHIDKHRIKLATFIAALFYDLSTEIQWLPTTCTDGQPETDPMLTDDALELLVAKLRTPLQIQLHLTLALEAGYQAGERPVPVEVVESVLSRHILDSCR